MTALCATVGVSAAASTVPSQGETQSAQEGEGAGGGPLSIPYLGELKVGLGPGWAVGPCADVIVPEGIESVCDASGVLLRAPNYDAAWGERVLSVPLVMGAHTTTIDYRIVLEPPTPPVLAGGVYGYPFESGSNILLPLSELGIECTSCGSGATIEVLGVEPAQAALVTVSSTHLVLRASAGYAGDAAVTLQVSDAAGQKSEPSSFTVRLVDRHSAKPDSAAPSGAAEAPLGALHIYVPRAFAEAATVNLLDLVWGPAAESVQLLGCGQAAAGVVSCDADGNAHYAPSLPASVDQFSFHVFSTNGQQATGSVTFVDSAALQQADAQNALPSEGLVGSPLTTLSPLAVATRASSPQAEDDPILAPLSRIFDRMQTLPAEENQ